MILCANCGHADHWHDDRAVTACLPRVNIFDRFLRCGCPGWRA